MIGAGGSQNVTVTFAPTAATSYNGNATVNSNATSGTNTIAASGTGTLTPTRIVALSGSLAFGNVAVNGTSTATLTIRNSGNAALTVNSISYPSGFSGNWSGTIGAGNSQNVTVTFAPTVATSYNGNVTVSSNATSGTNTTAISGTGVSGAQYNVTPSAGVNGNISPNTVQPVNSGGSVSFTATPTNGYVVDLWLVDGIVTPTGREPASPATWRRSFRARPAPDAESRAARWRRSRTGRGA